MKRLSNWREFCDRVQINEFHAGLRIKIGPVTPFRFKQGKIKTYAAGSPVIGRSHIKIEWE